jgi:hypothetical protein
VLAHFLRQLISLDDPQKYITALEILLLYDISCAYWVHLVECFEAHFPDLVDAVKRIRCLIPLVHVQNHKDNCTYLYSSAYTHNAGHFHRETAEQYWVELNPLGPQIRQMNHGRCHDTIINAHNHWNWKKVEAMSTSLKNQILDAELLHLQHRKHWEGLTEYFTKKGRNIEAWKQQNRTARVKSYNKNRDALIALGTPAERYPPMTEADTHRKPTNTKHQLGDSRRGDGITWTMSGAAGAVGASDIVVGRGLNRKRKLSSDGSPSKSSHHRSKKPRGADAEGDDTPKDVSLEDGYGTLVRWET